MNRKPKRGHLSLRSALKAIFLISLLATIGSLYYWYYGDPAQNFFTWYRFNTLNGIPACDLCRYIRVCQYPILIISGIALRQNDENHAFTYIVPLARIGLCISLYKYLLEMNILPESGVCSAWSTSCATPWVIYLWFATLAFFGIVCFTLILLLKALSHQDGNDMHT